LPLLQTPATTSFGDEKERGIGEVVGYARNKMDGWMDGKWAGKQFSVGLQFPAKPWWLL
jgi:hypothetical protein